MASDLKERRERLRFRSWHRGTKEMDLILGTFADLHIHTLSERQLDEYEELLLESDPDLYNWYAGRESAPPEKNGTVMKLLLGHKVAA
ncbi:MAG: succinate dehydrogenase assembly factor 2 [Alphaproteobacteria bacterium]|nr:succinate dehydrogenase assembly factor 2 [Alphaproteobacteria bacterium]